MRNKVIAVTVTIQLKNSCKVTVTKPHLFDIVTRLIESKGVRAEIVKRAKHVLVKIYRKFPFFLDWDTLLDIVDILENHYLAVEKITSGRRGIILLCKAEYTPLQEEYHLF